MNAPARTAMNALSSLFANTNDDVVEGRVTEPPKRWRNKYWNSSPPLCDTCKQIHAAGESFSCRVYPSREVAEARAEYYLSLPCNARGFKYLGAFPVDDAP